MRFFLAYFISIIAITACTTAESVRFDYQERPFYFFDSAEGYTADIALADVDGDGDLDALVANGRHWAQQDFVYLNSGNGRLLEAIPVGSRRGPSYVLCPGDFDGDGDIDLVVVHDVLPAQLFLNDGKANFKFARDIPGSGGNARSAIAFDANNDGALDVVIVTRRGPDIVFFGDGTGKFPSSKALPGKGRGSTGVAGGDMDGDNDEDLVIARRNGEHSVVMWNDGAGNFTAELLEGSGGDHRKAVIADFNSDGANDIILVGTNGLHKLYLSKNKSSFSKLTVFGTEGRKAQAMAAGDLDGDGDIDLVEGTETTNAIYYNLGAGSFERFEIDATAADTYGVAVGDLNSDNKLDFVFANSEDTNLVVISRKPRR